MRKIIQILLLLTSITTLGQETIKVKGRVVSKQGSYLIGAVIILNGTNVGTISDACGHFSISVPKDLQGQLNISFFSTPTTFNLRLLKDQDLDKTIILKDCSVYEKKKDKRRERKNYNLNHGCNDLNKNSLSFKIK